MDIEKILISPKIPTSRKRIQILKELIQIYRTARKSENITSSIKTLEVLARELGLLNDQKGQLENLSLEDLSDEILQKIVGSNSKIKNVTVVHGPPNAPLETPAETL